MGLFKDVTQTVKNIFNADDDMMFDDENDFKDVGSQDKSSPKIPFIKPKQTDKPFQINGSKGQAFDLSSHGFDMIQNGGGRKQRSNGKIQVYVPKTFEEAFNIIKDVKAGFTAMVNVEVANPQISQRIIDLISGAIYALDGECKKMGEKQYIFSLSAETIGAYDYLPTGGLSGQMDQNSQSQGYGFNGGTPFSFLNQPMNQQYNQPQYNQQFGQQQYGNQQFQGFTQKSFNQNQQGGGLDQNGNKQPDYSKFYIPPKSQF